MQKSGGGTYKRRQFVFGKQHDKEIGAVLTQQFISVFWFSVEIRIKPKRKNKTVSVLRTDTVGGSEEKFRSCGVENG